MLKNILWLLLSLTIPFHLFADDVPPDTVTTSISQINLDGAEHLAISFKNAQKWHTYWINPGDAGLPIKFDFAIDGKPLALQPTEWPVPMKLVEEGDVHVYGLEGEYSLFFKLPSLTSFNQKDFLAKITWLVCKHICIPGQNQITGKFVNNTLILDNAQPFIVSSDQLTTRFKNLPEKSPWPTKLHISLHKKENDEALTLHYEIDGGKADRIRAELNILNPYPLEPFDFRHERLFQSGEKIIGETLIEWDGEYQDPKLPLPANGIFAKPYTLKFLYLDPETGLTTVIEKRFTTFDLTPAPSTATLIPLKASHQIKEKLDVVPEKGLDKKEIESDLKRIKQMAYYILLALIGGLILNVMPCVLPVISLKLFGLIKHQGASRSTILRHNLFYTLGILFSFSLLALSIVMLKSVGESVGWGFQLQSPIFVAIMIIFLVLFALNLFGLYEFITPGGRFLGNLKLEDSAWGDFFNGIFATILSTPCSAPFLGTALTFAFTESSSAIFLIFFFIGIGLALPFLITALFPQFLNFMPKPGPWMDKLKSFFGLSLLLTAIWLLDLFMALTTSSVVTTLLLLLSLLFFAIYFYAYISKNRFWIIIFFLLPALLTFQLYKEIKMSAETTNVIIKKELPWEKWSPEKLDELKNKGELVFIDFTAKWCLTCKVNEELVLNTDGFKKLVEKYKPKLLLADWTKGDPIITEWLKLHGKAGVPAYYILTREGKLISLGETISIGKIEKNLN